MPAAVLYPENTLIAKRFQDKVQQSASDKEADRNPCPFCCVLMTDKLGKFFMKKDNDNLHGRCGEGGESEVKESVLKFWTFRQQYSKNVVFAGTFGLS